MIAQLRSYFCAFRCVFESPFVPLVVRELILLTVLRHSHYGRFVPWIVHRRLKTLSHEFADARAPTVFLFVLAGRNKVHWTREIDSRTREYAFLLHNLVALGERFATGQRWRRFLFVIHLNSPNHYVRFLGFFGTTNFAASSSADTTLRRA